MYAALADWWHLLSSPADYGGEATDFRRIIETVAADTGTGPIKTMLELGCGGGNSASHLKKHYVMTLVDVSPGMLTMSRRLNPDCEHAAGDMRTVRLDRTFDAVFIHDAVMYMTTVDDLRRVMETAFIHCRPRGVSLWVPDHTVETFKPSTSHGGHDGEDGRGLRYVEWTCDPDPADTTTVTDFAYLLKAPDGSVRAEHDRHVMGLFSRDVWIRELESAGFTVRVFPDSFDREIFVGVRRK